MGEIPARPGSVQTPWMTDISLICERFTAVERDLNARSRRLLAAVEAENGRSAVWIRREVTCDGRRTRHDWPRVERPWPTPAHCPVRFAGSGGGCPTLIAKTTTVRRPDAPWNTCASCWSPDDNVGDPMRPLMRGIEASVTRETGGVMRYAVMGQQDLGRRYPQTAGFAEIQSRQVEPQDPERQP